MGNVPAKESRSRSNTYSSTNSGRNVESTILLTRSGRRNTIGSSSDSRKLIKQQEKDKQRELHHLNLIVRSRENVDGGYLAPFGTYKSNLDFSTEVVRKLIINRQLAPFFTPLPDFSDDWSDKELLTILRQLPLHSIDDAYSDPEEIDDIDAHKINKSVNYYKRQEQKEKLRLLKLEMKELQKSEELSFLEDKLKIQSNQNSDNINKHIPNSTLLLKLYRNSTECPICFLFYPRYLNVSRCCLQPICSECFVQIKRLDPHPPHDDPSVNSNETPHQLISEVACCPYCASSDFGVTYDSPIDVNCGIQGTCKAGDYTIPYDDINGDESSDLKVKKPTRMRRRSSLAANAPGVITIDMIRPDWETKLTNARNKLARRAATASAIHASNLLLDDNSSSGNSGRRRNREQTYEDRMIEEALRLSIIDEEERKRKAAAETQ
jgi:hypothetical protein